MLYFVSKPRDQWNAFANLLTGERDCINNVIIRNRNRSHLEILNHYWAVGVVHWLSSVGLRVFDKYVLQISDSGTGLHFVVLFLPVQSKQTHSPQPTMICSADLALAETRYCYYCCCEVSMNCIYAACMCFLMPCRMFWNNTPIQYHSSIYVS